MWRRPVQAMSPERLALARIKSAATALLPAGTAVSVNEIVCNDPGCPGTETVLLIMQPGTRTRAVKLPLAAVDVTDEALAAALRGD